MALTIQELLEGLSATDAERPDPGELWELLRQALTSKNPKVDGEDVYVAFRDLVFQSLRGHRPPSELREWVDIAQDAQGLLTHQGHCDFAARFPVLIDLLVAAAREGEVQSTSSLLSREHVRRVLSTLRHYGPRAERTKVQAAIGIGQATLSKLLSALESAGLIERERDGRKVWLQLTPAGLAGSEASLGGASNKVRRRSRSELASEAEDNLENYTFKHLEVQRVLN